MIFGLDISVYQGSPNWRAFQDFEQVCREGQRCIEFVMLRTEDGLNKDKQFSNFCMGLNGIGFYDLGTYMFFRASKPVKDQVLQAVAMHGDLPGPLAVDMETLDGVEPQLAADATIEALEGVHAMTGRKPLLYTDLGDWSKLGAWGKQADFARYPLWLAAVTEDPLRKTFVPPPWTDAIMRQYTWKRRVPGINADCDGDVFFGDVQAWRDVGR